MDGAAGRLPARRVGQRRDLWLPAGGDRRRSARLPHRPARPRPLRARDRHLHRRALRRGRRRGAALRGRSAPRSLSATRSAASWPGGWPRTIPISWSRRFSRTRRCTWASPPSTSATARSRSSAISTRGGAGRHRASTPTRPPPSWPPRPRPAAGARRRAFGDDVPAARADALLRWTPACSRRRKTARRSPTPTPPRPSRCPCSCWPPTTAWAGLPEPPRRTPGHLAPRRRSRPRRGRRPRHPRRARPPRRLRGGARALPRHARLAGAPGLRLLPPSGSNSG